MISIPITVLGGYLGSGKTTLLNALLQRSDGRRIGVVVNDFGDLAVDAELLAEAVGESPLVSLANGCVCCTLGDDLRAVLDELAHVDPPLEHIVIEASGVADPGVLAAWGTVPPFRPGGVVVLAAADSVMTQARDRYVGGEVRRQLERADVVLLTKGDRCAPSVVHSVQQWVGELTSAPVVRADFGDVPFDVVFGAVASIPLMPTWVTRDEHLVQYERWTLEWSGAVRRDVLDGFLDTLPAGLLRLKGVVEIEERTMSTWHVVNVVGRSVAVHPANGQRENSVLTAIGCIPDLDVDELHRAALAHGLGLPNAPGEVPTT